MEKTIFALKGRAKVGKTSTIKIIYDLFKNNYESATFNEIIFNTDIDPDIKVIIAIDGIKIGIESQGDPYGRLKDSLTDFVENGCQIIICASRTKGMTKNWIEYYSNHFKIEWIKKQISQNKENQNRDNQAQANKIFEEVKNLIQE